MKRLLNIAMFVVFVTTMHSPSLAVPDCASLMKFGIYDKFSTFTSEQHYRQVQSFFSSNQFSSRLQAEQKAAAAGLNLVGILDLNLGGKSSSVNFEEWKSSLLQTSFQEASSAGLKMETVETISAAMTTLIGDCIKQKGVHAYIIPASDQQTFTFTIDYVPSGDDKPSTKGFFTVMPATVAATASPKNIVGNELKIGPQGFSVSMRRLPTETVTITYQTADGSGSVFFEPVKIPEATATFSANAETIEEGQSVRLTWNVQNARKIEISGIGEVGDSGTVSVSPTKETTYLLKAVSANGKLVTKTVIVKVTQAPPPPPVLVSGQVHIRTTDDNKDHDTHFTVNIISGSATVATMGGVFGEFKDNTSFSHDLTVVNRVEKATLLAAGRVQLIEAPNGHDEWHFNWTVILKFSDGSEKRCDWQEPRGVDYDRTTLTKSMCQ